MRIRETGCDDTIKLSKFKFNCDEVDKSIPDPLPQNLNHFLGHRSIGVSKYLGARVPGCQGAMVYLIRQYIEVCWHVLPTTVVCVYATISENHLETT